MVKVISLSNKAYMTLKALKRGDDSFSDTVLKLTEKEKKPSVLDFWGKWPGSKDSLDLMEKEIEKGRKHAKTREVTF
jgi:predicted CopG family antitoxin